MNFLYRLKKFFQIIQIIVHTQTNPQCTINSLRLPKRMCTMPTSSQADIFLSKQILSYSPLRKVNKDERKNSYSLLSIPRTNKPDNMFETFKFTECIINQWFFQRTKMSNSSLRVNIFYGFTQTYSSN
jgi:hypothetical protein